MSDLARFLLGPWRAVLVLSLTQIVAWGAIYYTPVLMVPLIAADHGWSLSLTMSGLSVGILVAGLVSPRMGALVDRYGGHRVMPVGSLLGALGLFAITHATHPAAYFAVWAVLGVAMAGSLYDPAFASLGRIFGAAARRPITALTLAGAFASTVSWPVTRILVDTFGWRATYLAYAAVLAGIAAPLHAFLLPRTRAAAETPAPAGAPALPPKLPAQGRAFLLVVTAFAVYAFVPSGLLANLLAMFARLGLDPATAVAIGALFGPCQMAARLCELLFARNVHPLDIARLAVGCLVLAFAGLAALGLSPVVAAAFVMLLGLCNGLMTLARGTVPLALFGAAGYGRLIGRIAGPALVVQSAAPVVVAFVAEQGSDRMAMALAGLLAVIALSCFLAVPRPFTHRQG
ncbi:MAG TPA: MFS transporter [Xanthobacteraceae bacterium]|nr:MFS transporter [Xanthobacteraceae bacterium]